MRMLNDKVVALAVEAGSVSHFLEKTWDLGLVDAKSLVDCLCGHAVHDARGRFDRHRVWSAIIAGINARDANLKSQLGPLAVEVATEVAAAYDVTHRVLCSLLYQNSRVAQAGRQLDGQWDFEAKCDAVKRDCFQQLPGLGGVRPKDWKHHDDTDFDLSAAQAIFLGHNSTSTQSMCFVERISGPRTRTEHDEHGCSPDRTLISAIYGHFLFLVEHNNTVHVEHDLKNLKLNLAFRVEGQMQLEFNAQSLSPLTLAMVENAYAETMKIGFTQEEYKRALERAISRDALSQAQKDLRKREVEAKAAALFSELAPEPDPAHTFATELKWQRDDALKRCLARYVDAPSDDCEPAFAWPS